MPAHRLRSCLAAAAVAGTGAGFALPGTAAAQAAPPVSELQVALWASSCMACHGTDGKAEGTGLRLHGQPADKLFGALRAFRSGERSATVMHQHARGYSEAELARIASWFAARP